MKASFVIALLALSTGAAVGLLVDSLQDEKVHFKEEEDGPKKDKGTPTWGGEQMKELAAKPEKPKKDESTPTWGFEQINANPQKPKKDHADKGHFAWGGELFKELAAKHEKAKKDKGTPTWGGEQIEDLAANPKNHLQKVRDNYLAAQKKVQDLSGNALGHTLLGFSNQAQKMNNKQVEHAISKAEKSVEQKQAALDKMNQAAQQMANKKVTNLAKQITKAAELLKDKEADEKVLTAAHQIDDRYAHLARKKGQKNPVTKARSDAKTRQWELSRQMLGEKHPEKKGEPIHIPRHGKWDQQRKMVNAKHQQAKAYKKSLQRTMNLQHHHPPKDLEHSWVTSHMAHSR